MYDQEDESVAFWGIVDQFDDRGPYQHNTLRRTAVGWGAFTLVALTAVFVLLEHSPYAAFAAFCVATGAADRFAARSGETNGKLYDLVDRTIPRRRPGRF